MREKYEVLYYVRGLGYFSVELVQILAIIGVLSFFYLTITSFIPFLCKLTIK